MASIIYLASPYSHNSAAVREDRYLSARRFTILQLQRGVAIFSPIVYGKDMETQIGTAFEPWANLNDSMIRACAELWVLMLDGWEKSRGIRHELQLAQDLGKPIKYLDHTGGQDNADYRHHSAR